MTLESTTSSNSFAPFLDKLADAASAAIMPHFRQGFEIDNKWEDGFDPVTIADKNGETAIRELINEFHPEHGILGEEHGPENLDAEHVWVLDPIDGTRAFITGLPTWGTLIGLKSAGTPRLGMMVQPYVGERYGGDCNTAWYRGPLGERTLKTRSCERLEDATIFTTTPAIFTSQERAAFDRIESMVQLSRYGTDCYAYCMVAAGHGDAVIESGLQAYDIVALVPIIEGAGGVVTTWTGGSPADGGQILASGDPRLHDLLLKELSMPA
ncbi:MAG: histidinol-phosphatase [Roseibium sp.]|uniref:histidinol-phosphatase n=1 Tax=Roseibium sp. TaxID=1936156 RepID=UPI001B220151|nr:histidinol-phosphatase [Roseibium sp.]MBO6507215.1 histidinol-phosphatase [Roseibium sp.]MBO6892941.1 histidinol-phosphatase [Roseibium sp.]MBO6928042.1 histidinol-phosphatase [Roseibium sp.]